MPLKFLAQKNVDWALILGVILIGHILAYKIIHIPQQLEAVVLFALIVAVPIIKSPIVGMYLLLILVPFVTALRRLYYLIYGRPNVDPLLVVGECLLALMMIGLFFQFKERLNSHKLVSIFTSIVVAYFIYLAIRVVAFTIMPLSEALPKFKLYGPMVLLFFIGTLFAERLNDLRRFWVLTLIIAVISTIYGIKQLYLGFSEAERVWFSSIDFSTLFIEEIIRPFSFFQAPVAFADYLILGMIAVLILWTLYGPAFKIAALLSAPLLLYGVLITSVRSNWIGFAAVIVVWFAVVKIRGMAARLAILGTLTLGIMGYSFLNDGVDHSAALDTTVASMTSSISSERHLDLLITNRTSALTNPFGEHSLLSRMALWRYIFRLSAEPELALLGRGLGALSADSLYITYLAEFGYPGMIFILGLIIAFIIVGLKCIDAAVDPLVIALARGITVLNIVFAVVSFTGTHIHSFPGDVYFWFFNGVLVKLASIQAGLPRISKVVFTS